MRRPELRGCLALTTPPYFASIRAAARIWLGFSLLAARAISRPMNQLETPAQKIYRYLGGTLLLVGLFGTMLWLQGRFDQSDHRKAIAFVRSHQLAPGTMAFGGWFDEAHGVQEWRAEILSGMRGILRVEVRDGAGQIYAFEVDLVKHELVPRTFPAEEALAAWQRAVEGPAPEAARDPGEATAAPGPVEAAPSP